MDLHADDTGHASSADGRRFDLHGIHADLGAFVIIDDGPDHVQIGQLDAAASGAVLGAITAGGVERSDTFPFEHATARAADAAETELIFGREAIRIGSLQSSDAAAARIFASRFNRHTFWCGQSGSGKTYALGVVLEQLLIHTRLPMVILDPNGDFVHLDEGEGELADRDVRVLRPTSASAPLRVRFTELSMPAKAAVLRLDPLRDRGEYNELLHIEDTVRTLNADHIVPRLLEKGTDAARQLAERVENLRVVDWEVWAGAIEPVTEIIEERPDATVLDLGGFVNPEESLVVALALLEDLWAKRESRRPLLIVIDEAHNLCSPDPSDPLHEAVRARIEQIAAEGRKFGLWLLLSTQRPSKIHSGIISQCDNLALMRMSSPGDLAQLGSIFGFVPTEMLARAPWFRKGEALFAGGFVPAPLLLKMGGRRTPEGGIDVAVPLV